MSWLYLPVQVADFSPLSGSGGTEPSVTSNGSSTQPTSSSSESQTDGSMMPLSGTTLEHSTGHPGVDWWILSLRGSPVSPLGQWFSQKAGINPSSLWLLEIACLPTEVDGEMLRPLCKSMALELEKSKLKDASKQKQPTNTPFTVELKAESGTTKSVPMSAHTQPQSGHQRVKLNQAFTDWAIYYQNQDILSFPQIFGGLSGDTLQMDGELTEKQQDRVMLQLILGELLSAAQSMSVMNYRNGSNAQDYTLLKAKNEPSSSSTLYQTSFTDGQGNSGISPTGKQSQESPLNWTKSDLNSYSLDGQPGTGTEGKQKTQPTGELPPQANRSFWVWLWLQEERSESYPQSENTPHLQQSELKDELSPSDRNTSSLPQTSTDPQLLTAIIHGNLSEVIKKADMEQYITLQLMRMSPTWRMELLSTTASHSPRPESGKGQQTSVMAGLTPFALLEKSSPSASFSKTYPDSFQQRPTSANAETAISGMMPDGTLFTALSAGNRWIKPQATLFDTSVPFSETWPRAGMMQDGACLALTKWGQTISGIGSGLRQQGVHQWLTPSTMMVGVSEYRREKRTKFRESIGRKDAPGSLLEQVQTPKFWRTESASDGEGGVMDMSKGDGRFKLRDHVQQVNSSYWPTPTANDNDNRRTKPTPSEKEGRHGWSLKSAIVDDADPSGSRLWPTPTVNGNHNRHGLSPNSGDGLSTAVKNKFWPTPNTMDSLQPRDHDELREWNNSRDGRKNRNVLSNLREAVHDQKYKESFPTPNTLDSLPPKSAEALHREATVTRPGRKNPSNLRDVVSNGSNWPTPTADDASNVTRASGAFQSLTRQAQSFPTPSATGHKGSGANGTSRDRLDYAIERGETNSHSYDKPDTPGQLNPDWVEWLMGWPIGWTSLGPLPVESFIHWLKTTINGEWWDEEPNIPRLVPSGTAENRVGRLKALGNGQVALQAAVAWIKLNEDLEVA